MAAPIAPQHRPPRALTRAGIPPPIAMLWSIANRLPAATLPIPACIAAAIEPIGSKRLDVASIMRQRGTHRQWARQCRSQQCPAVRGPGKGSARHRQQRQLRRWPELLKLGRVEYMLVWGCGRHCGTVTYGALTKGKMIVGGDRYYLADLDEE